MLLTAVCVAAVGFAAPVPKAVSKAPKLDGKWKIAELNANGTDVTAYNPWVWEIDGERVNTLSSQNGRLQPIDREEKTAVVRPTGGGPADVDYVLDRGGHKSVFKGLISVVGDELTICFSDPGLDRPAEAKVGKTFQYLRFTRITDK